MLNILKLELYISESHQRWLEYFEMEITFMTFYNYIYSYIKYCLWWKLERQKCPGSNDFWIIISWCKQMTINIHSANLTKRMTQFQQYLNLYIHDNPYYTLHRVFYYSRSFLHTKPYFKSSKFELPMKCSYSNLAIFILNLPCQFVVW